MTWWAMAAQDVSVRGVGRGTPFAKVGGVRLPLAGLVVAVVGGSLVVSVGGCVGVIGDGAPGEPSDPSGDPSGAPDAGVDAAPPDFTVTVAPQATTELGARVQQAIDVGAVDGFAGPVALAVTGAPAGWTVAIEPASVTVGAGPAHATLSIMVPTNADAPAAGVPLTITGTAAPGTRAATTTIMVDDVFTLALGTPGATGQHFPTYAGGQLRMKRGATLRIMNGDAIAHRIHSDAGVDGFPHQATSMGTGGAYTVTLTSTGSDTFYCHDHGQGTGTVRLTVE